MITILSFKTKCLKFNIMENIFIILKKLLGSLKFYKEGVIPGVNFTDM